MGEDLRARAARIGMQNWPYGMTTEQAQREMLGWAEQHGLRYSPRGRTLQWLTRGRGDVLALRKGGMLWYDHVTGWTSDGVPRVLVSQPYLRPDDMRDRLDEVAVEWGVRVETAEAGWYGYGTSFVALWNDHTESRAHRQAVTPWRDVEAIITRHGGRRIGPSKGRRRSYQIGTPPRGYFTVEVDLWHGWGSVAVDRWGTGDRPPEAAEWFRANVWPTIDAALRERRGGGAKPAGHTYAGAQPLRRSDVPGLLDTWLTKEIEWGQGVMEGIRR